MPVWKSNLGPREKMLTIGPKAVDDQELLCILLSTGPRRAQGGDEPSVREFAKQLLEQFTGLVGLFQASPDELSAISGIGPAKLSRLMAVREITSRIWSADSGTAKTRLTSSRLASRIFADLYSAPEERVAAAFLDTQQRLIRTQEIFRGSLNSAIAEPREILRAALKANAASLVVAHNHPSGDPTPSEEDMRFTVKLQWAADTVGIPLLDHLILGASGNYFSFVDAKLLMTRLPPPSKRRGSRRQDDPGRYS